MSVKVSVIIPVYGVERFIARCADSLFSQTMQDGVEFIFVDDCTPDRSIEVMKEVLERYHFRKPQVRIVRPECNGGLYKARQLGLVNAQGEYIQFVDSDDFIEKNMLETMLTTSVANNADITVCRFNLVNEIDDSVTPSVLRDRVVDKDKYLGYVISMISRNASPNIFNKMYKKSVCDKVKVAPLSDIPEDWVFNVQAVNVSEKIVAIDDVLYNYLVRKDSLSHYSDIEVCRSSNKGDMANIDRIIEYLEEEGLADKYRNEIEAHKYIAKGSFNNFCESPEYYKEWRDVYREVNKTILFNPCLSFYDRKCFVLRTLRLKSKYSKMTDQIRRLLKCIIK